MSLVVLSQPLRQREAAQYLHTLGPGRKVVVTRFLAELDTSEFPADTEFRSWSPDPKPPPSTRAISGLKRRIRGGSGIGLRLERWLRSAEWRLRYLDRVAAMIGARKDSHWDLMNPALIEVLENALQEDAEGDIAVFDLFDLPAVLSSSRSDGRSVHVR